MKIQLFSILLLLGFLSSGQESIDIESLTKRFPDESAVVLKNTTDILIEFDELHPIIRITNEESKAYLKENTALRNKEIIPFSKERRLIDIEAYSYLPKGKKFSKQKIDEPIYSDDLGGASFASDDRRATFLFPGLTRGAQTYKKTILEVTDPHRVGLEFLSDYYPVEEMSYRLEVEKGIEIQFRFFNTTLTESDIKITEERKYTIYEITLSQLSALRMEDGTPGFRSIVPHFVYTIKGYQNKDGYVRVFQDMSDLHDWYCDFQKSVDFKPSEQIRAVADSIGKLHLPELDRVKAIYQWVQNNIKYILVSEGDGGFQSQDPSFTCDKRYGDCKAMSTLLISIASHLDIAFYPTWVGTRELPYTYETLPTPHTDNHMIATYIGETRKYYLDATYSKLPFGFSPPFIQGKQVMISKNCETFELAFVPEVPSEANRINDEIIVRLNKEDFTLEGTGVLSATGLSKMEIRSRYQRTDYKQKYLRALLLKGENNFNLVDYTIQGMGDSDSTLVIHYSFELPNYAMKLDSDVFLNLHVETPSNGDKIVESRQFPIEIDFKNQKRLRVELRDFNPYKLINFPEDTQFEGPNMRYIRTIKSDINAIILEQTIDQSGLNILPVDFKDHNLFVKKLNKAYRQSIQLKLP